MQTTITKLLWISTSQLTHNFVWISGKLRTVNGNDNQIGTKIPSNEYVPFAALPYAGTDKGQPTRKIKIYIHFFLASWIKGI